MDLDSRSANLDTLSTSLTTIIANMHTLNVNMDIRMETPNGHVLRLRYNSCIAAKPTSCNVPIGRPSIQGQTRCNPGLVVRVRRPLRPQEATGPTRPQRHQKTGPWPEEPRAPRPTHPAATTTTIGAASGRNNDPPQNTGFQPTNSGLPDYRSARSRFPGFSHGQPMASRFNSLSSSSRWPHSAFLTRN